MLSIIELGCKIRIAIPLSLSWLQLTIYCTLEMGNGQMYKYVRCRASRQVHDLKAIRSAEHEQIVKQEILVKCASIYELYKCLVSIYPQ
jgi:hypothetical protein